MVAAHTCGCPQQTHGRVEGTTDMSLTPTTHNERDIARQDHLVRLFTVIAVVEALTWAGLLIGMYVKYIPQTTELGVRIFGSLHGAAFICYIIVTVLLIRRREWRIRWLGAAALVASIPPFATVAFELWAVRAGHLPRRVARR